jgi:uracil-DNA glycosylase family 4
MNSAPFTEGPLNADFVLVGEAPGATEARKGGAFIGQAGDLLNSCLASAGISRSRCRLENVFQFHPTSNDLDPYIRIGAKGATFESEDFLRAREALKERLECTSANVIIPLGNIALYTLTGKHGITKQRGSLLPSTLIDRKCLPSIHPAAALQYGQTQKFLEGQRKKSIDPYVYRHWIVYDLRRAKEEARKATLDLPRRSLHVEPSFRDVREYLSACRSQSRISFDIECTRGRDSEVTHIAFAQGGGDALCIPFVTGTVDYWPPDQEAEVWRMIAETLEDPSVTKIAQNAIFDVSFLHRRHGIVTTPLECTMIATATLFPDYPAGLDFLVSLYCGGEPYYKDDGKQWMRNAFGSENVFREYNARDAAVLMDIFPKQEIELKRIGNWSSYQRQRNLILPLVYAANKGILMDLSCISDLSHECEVQIKEFEDAWLAALHPDAEKVEYTSVLGDAMFGINPNSPKQLANYFYTTLGNRPYTKRNKNGKTSITTDDKALKRLVTKGISEAQLLLSYRKAAKLKGTYLDMELDSDSRLRCAYNPVGTGQVRISSSQNIFGTGGNQQNQPPIMKALMRPDPGFILVNQDLAQAENRTVAFVANEAKMISAFDTGIDLHRQTAGMIYECSIEEVSSDQREWGKRANHGLNYDLGPRTFAIYYQIDESQAKHIINRYHAAYPGVREWHATIRDELNRNNRTLINCYNQRRVFLGKPGHDLFKVAYSFIPQSSVANKVNQDGFVYIYYNQEALSEVEFLNSIHDSIQYQVPLEVGSSRIIEIIKTIKASLESEMSWKDRRFSIPTDTELGFSFDKSKMLEWKAAHINSSSESDLITELEQYVEERNELD